MLHSELDVEVIRSAMLAGEVDDAMAWIDHALEKITIYRRVTKKGKYDSRERFLATLRRFLSGEISKHDLREEIEKIPGIRSQIVDPEEFGEFLDNFLYEIGLAADRYNVRFPEFDGKRCDDK